MSFFSSLQQYVTSGVAGLSLNPRKFSFSRQDSSERSVNPNIGTPCTSDLTGAPPNSSLYGYPKVIPIQNVHGESSVAQTQSHSNSRRQSKNLECHVSPKQGSLRQKISPVTHKIPNCPVFCKRRQSWPEVNLNVSSGVQDSDGSYFECFSSVKWKLHNKFNHTMKAAETRAKTLCVKDSSLGTIGNSNENVELMEQLYLEVLSAISNSLGAQTIQENQSVNLKEEMYLQAQMVFNFSSDRHYRLLNVASEEKPKIIVLSVIVLEAEGLEAKDANGFSDPYCMLGIQPGGNIYSPQAPMSTRTLSESGMESFSMDLKEPSKLRKHNSFRLSFKRKECRRENYENIGPVPAKFIQVTTVKQHTLCPKWNEKFQFDIDDISTDILHLDIWDHDDESSVIEAVSKLNEVKGVKGLSRFFKQVCQSARQGSQDDFLGSLDVHVCDIPSKGLEGWFNLEAKHHRSSVQGRIKLKVWLSTREDCGSSEEDTLKEVQKLEQLYRVFILHEIATIKKPCLWNGELNKSSLAILHQISVQADISELKIALARFVATSRLNCCTALDPKIMHRFLIDIDKSWTHNIEPVSRDLEVWLAEAMNAFVDESLVQVKQHREAFPALNQLSLVRLEYLLRCLGLLGSMRAFRQVSPFSKGIRGEIVTFLRKGSVQWAQTQLREANRTPNPIIHFISTLVADLQLGLAHYHNIFDTTNGIQYFSIIYKQFDYLLSEEITYRINNGSLVELNLSNHWTVLEGDREIPDTKSFEIYFALQEFSNLRKHLSVMPQPPENPLRLQFFHEWFDSILQRWVVVSKEKLVQRVRKAIQMDKICTEGQTVYHSSSSIDTTACFSQLKEFWYHLNWPEIGAASNIEFQIIESICSAAIQYADLSYQKLAETGFFEPNFKPSKIDEICVSVNNLEYIRRFLNEAQSNIVYSNEEIENIIQRAVNHIEQKIEKVLAKINTFIQISIHKAVFHLAWSPDSLPAEQAINPLFDYLEVQLSTLNVALFPKNFRNVLRIIWVVILNEISLQIDTGNDSEQPNNFHERLYEALNLLSDFFHAEGLGLPTQTGQCEIYWQVEHKLHYHKTETERLIDHFYIQRLQDQCFMTDTKYGVLIVRAYFNHDSLCVEIIAARDVIPLDPNGFSDPFVIVELLPRRIFSHCTEQHTNVCKKTLNPVFDECFEFSVSREQCLHEAAMVIFTVMDHDVLTANDFAGEAFLGLNNVPGISEFTTSIDNFHGLKHVELHLMHQKEKCNPILQTLESRVSDKQATDFVRKQKSRMSL